MTVGNPSSFAIESQITHAFSALGLRALGFFVLHIGGLSFGVRRADATYLANSLDQVDRRLAKQGRHVCSFVENSDAGEIAKAFRDGMFADNPRTTQLGVDLSEFQQVWYRDNLVLAPDGDSAFDDGSYVLHFDVNDRVRIIAFKSAELDYVKQSLREVWLSSDEFYAVLKQWRTEFEKEWELARKDEVIGPTLFKIE